VVEIDSIAGKVAFEAGGYAILVVPEHLAAGDRGRVLILGGGAGPPAADGIESIAGLAFIDDGPVFGEECDDRIDVTLGVELEVVLDDLGDVVERGLLLRLAMLSARASRHASSCGPAFCRSPPGRRRGASLGVGGIAVEREVLHHYRGTRSESGPHFPLPLDRSPRPESFVEPVSNYSKTMLNRINPENPDLNSAPWQPKKRDCRRRYSASRR